MKLGAIVDERETSHGFVREVRDFISITGNRPGLMKAPTDLMRPAFGVILPGIT